MKDVEPKGGPAAGEPSAVEHAQPVAGTQRPAVRWSLLLWAAGLAALAAGYYSGRVDPAQDGIQPPEVAPVPQVVEALMGASAEPMIEKFCSTCHVLPPPDVEPRSLWPAKIAEMYSYAESGRPWPMTQIPTVEAATAYWTARAPATLSLPPEVSGSPPSPLAFERQFVELAEIPSPPAVSNVAFVRLADDAPIQLLISDMRHGSLVLWTPSRPDEPAKVIGRVRHPSRTQVVDLDGDGIRDVLVADLGVFWNEDTDQGSVVWLRGRGGEEFQKIVLLDGISRVNEVQASDFDGDGDLDLVSGPVRQLHDGNDRLPGEPDGGLRRTPISSRSRWMDTREPATCPWPT